MVILIPERTAVFRCRSVAIWVKGISGSGNKVLIQSQNKGILVCCWKGELGILASWWAPPEESHGPLRESCFVKGRGLERFVLERLGFLDTNF